MNTTPSIAWLEFQETAWAILAESTPLGSQAPGSATAPASLSELCARSRAVIGHSDSTAREQAWQHLEAAGLATGQQLAPEWASVIAMLATSPVTGLATVGFGAIRGQVYWALDRNRGVACFQQSVLEPDGGRGFGATVRLALFPAAELWTVMQALLPPLPSLLAPADEYPGGTGEPQFLTPWGPELVEHLHTHPGETPGQALRSLDLPSGLRSAIDDASPSLTLSVSTVSPGSTPDAVGLSRLGRWSIGAGQLFSFEDRTGPSGTLEPAVVWVATGHCARWLEGAVAEAEAFLTADRAHAAPHPAAMAVAGEWS
ncbi:ESX secretion-associated protein EspG [Psychromicrobium xiongbiense]|uniref:ESX secretion-associated protein EspG n=1 Tax=Psychromicrobium xiongbiense TaxID=3051184 RepID=UPI002555C5B1|nr:ESX secretion-associated protein EspG [Psychromicrobium sp. YIM S02556]